VWTITVKRGFAYFLQSIGPKINFPALPIHAKKINKRAHIMVKFSTVEAREKLGKIIQKAAVEKERIILTRRGKELAALVPIEDMRFLEELEDRLDLEEARAALAEAKADPERPIPWEKLKAELGL
jgi:prevent-host-death family protein